MGFTEVCDQDRWISPGIPMDFLERHRGGIGGGTCGRDSTAMADRGGRRPRYPSREEARR